MSDKKEDYKLIIENIKKSKSENEKDFSELIDNVIEMYNRNNDNLSN